MRGRPRVNVELGGGGEVMLQVKETFRTKANAYRQLELSGKVEEGVFCRAWWGRAVTPGTHAKIDVAWVRWVRRMAWKYHTYPELLDPAPNVPIPEVGDVSSAKSVA
jgi:hypothetical protein